MTFEEAIDCLWKGQVLRRHGWEDPNQLAYLLYHSAEEGFQLFTANVSFEDSLCDDWYVWGWMQ